jgi:hypothetical protein
MVNSATHAMAITVILFVNIFMVTIIITMGRSSKNKLLVLQPDRIQLVLVRGRGSKQRINLYRKSEI